MDTYYDEVALDNSIDAKPLPAWCAFVMGGIVTFLLVYIGVARPAAQELASMRRQMNRFEQSLLEVAGKRDDVGEASSLLSALADQQESMDAARQSLDQLRQLQQQLVKEAKQTQLALSAVAELGALKDTLLANADRTGEAADVVATSEVLCERLASAADTTFDALEAGDNLLALRDDLIRRSEDADSAQQALNDLLQIKSSLDEEAFGVDDAQQRVEELLSIKDTIVTRTADLAQAIEALQVTGELNAQFGEAMLAFDRIRHWMVEVVTAEPLMERARQSLRPLTELGNLRNLPADQLLTVARRMADQGDAQVAAVPAEQDGENSAAH